MQRMKGRTSLTELVPFGEVIMFKVPKTGESVGSFEDRWESGVWLGATIRDGMTLVGTKTGVYKVGTIKRKVDGEQWSNESVMSLVGTRASSAIVTPCSASRVAQWVALGRAWSHGKETKGHNLQGR